MGHTPRNVVMILSDQHSVQALGCYGNSQISTPHLDQMAAEGTVFDAAYCQGPLCVPSRTSLLTGRYCRNHGVYDNQHILAADGLTLPRWLADAGYRTCLIGKAHFNGEQYHGYQQRPYGDFWGQAHQPDPARTEAKGESGLGDLIGDSGPSGIPLALTQTEICVAEATRWLLQQVDHTPSQPFFLSINFDKPHFPWNPPTRYLDAYLETVRLPALDPDELGRMVPFVQAAAQGSPHRYPGNGHEEREHARTLAAYYGCVTWVDDAVGRILEVIRYLGLADHTVVMYTADHGDMLGSHGLWQKTVFFESSSRVPLIVQGPDIPSGMRIADPVGHIDLWPTIAAWAGLAPPQGGDGLNLEPLLGRKPLAREGIFSESVVLKHPEQAGCMLRTGPWKYNWYLDGRDELYDLRADPDEVHSQAGNPEYGARISAFRERLHRFWQPEEQVRRYHRTPRMPREKHFYWWSNQFAAGDGAVFNGRP